MVGLGFDHPNATCAQRVATPTSAPIPWEHFRVAAHDSGRSGIAHQRNPIKQTGYRDRAGIAQIWRLHEQEADLILNHADENTLRKILRRQGTFSLLEDDFHKACEGVTSLAEIQSLSAS